MMHKILKKINLKLEWLKEDILWKLLKPEVNINNRNHVKGLTIGITTFMDRFEDCLKPLVKKISLIFPECEIIVIANGHFLKEKQKKYLEEIEKFCRRFGNIKLISYSDPRGLSSIWNLLIKQSQTERILLLNDDLRIKVDFREFISGSGILQSPVATINSSWSHFLITKSVVDNVGCFDENLKEIGGEDDDYSARLAIAGIELNNFLSKSVISRNKRKLRKLKLNSFGKNMAEQKGGYSSVNTEYLESKWIISDSYFDGSVFVPYRRHKYWKLR
jgi:GT2 family glycosyltransferase